MSRAQRRSHQTTRSFQHLLNCRKSDCSVRKRILMTEVRAGGVLHDLVLCVNSGNMHPTVFCSTTLAHCLCAPVTRVDGRFPWLINFLSLWNLYVLSFLPSQIFLLAFTWHKVFTFCPALPSEFPLIGLIQDGAETADCLLIFNSIFPSTLTTVLKLHCISNKMLILLNKILIVLARSITSQGKILDSLVFSCRSVCSYD